MKKFILILMVCLLPFAMDAQVKSNRNSTGSRNHNSSYEKGTEDRDVTIIVNDESSYERKVDLSTEVFISVEQMPQFPGGEAALMKFLQSHINYPPTAAKQNIQGKVIVMVVVERTGRVGDVKVVRSVDPELDAEAVRVCRSLPNFIPGRQNGQPVNVWYTIPITFRLQSVKQQANDNTDTNIGALARLQRIVKEMSISLPSFLEDGTSLWDVKVEGGFLVITIDVNNNFEKLQDLKQSEILNDISDIELGDFIVHNNNEKIKMLAKPTIDAGMGIKLMFQTYKINRDPAIFTIPYEVLEVCYSFTQI